MRIDQVHSRLLLILDTAQAGYFSPEQRDEALDMASLKLFTQFLPLYGTRLEIREALAPFKKRTDFETDDEGVFTIDGSERLLVCTVKILEGETARVRSAKIINEDERDSRLNSQLRQVSQAYPIVDQIGDGKYQIFPKTIGGGEVSYLVRPSVPKFAYTIANDEEVYDDANSVQMEWSDKYIDQIILGAISILGVSLDNQWLRDNGFALKQ